MEDRPMGSAGGIGEKLHVIADTVGGEEAKDAARLDELVVDDAGEQLLGVSEEFARFLAIFFVLQDGGVTAPEFPSVKEGRPIDERNECGQGNIFHFERTSEWRL